jgi:hypothetical protein
MVIHNSRLFWYKIIGLSLASGEIIEEDVNGGLISSSGYGFEFGPKCVFIDILDVHREQRQDYDGA